ncbi:MAG: hypothetical protein E6Q73_01690 [Pseudorhodobacter sp.]|nr:MAG: hypothetical protein E6Q73_01690 [Pseudorhodobacter sp.]
MVSAVEHIRHFDTRGTLGADRTPVQNNEGSMQGALLRLRRGVGHLARACGKNLALAALLALPATGGFAQSAIEMDAASANAGTQTTGVHVTTLPVTLRNNSDNPGGTTFGGVTPGPAPVATFTLSNQAYTAPTVPATVSSTRTGVFMGLPGDTAGNAYFAPLS